MKPAIRHHEVLEELGQGGMGKVYLARDPRLQRDVAIKVLPDVFAEDPHRLARFQREAQVLASLNHPHIAQIYGVEETGGRQALILELVEGPTGEVKRLVTSPFDKQALDISADGNWLAYSESHPETSEDIWVVDLREEPARPRPFLKTAERETGPVFSPDGRWIAYHAGAPGQEEVYVRSFPAAGERLQLSVEGGKNPLWNRAGRELYYRSGDRMMAVSIDTHGGVAASRPRLLFQGDFEFSYWVRNYDVAPNGRFLMMRTPPESTARMLVVVLNWFQELRELVPVD